MVADLEEHQMVSSLLTSSAFADSVETYPKSSQDELNDIDQNKLVIFVVATYGEGEPTDNAAEAFRYFTEEDHDGELNHINYTVTSSIN